MANNEPETQIYRLIKGKFNPDEASQVLMTLIDDEIRSHQRND